MLFRSTTWHENVETLLSALFFVHAFAIFMAVSDICMVRRLTARGECLDEEQSCQASTPEENSATH
jgi:uncharacterized membrane protein